MSQVFEDLGFSPEEAAELSARSAWLMQLKRAWAKFDFARSRLPGITEQEYEAIRLGHIDQLTVERLKELASMLEQP